MSYARLDDKYTEGHLTEFRERLEGAVRLHTGKHDFEIFQDKIHLKFGDNWQRRIKESLHEAMVLIPIITPSFFSSEACREELECFFERERELQQDNLIFPVYYVDTGLINDESKRNGHPLAQIIASRQYADWRELRLEPLSSPEAKKAVDKLGKQIALAPERNPETETKTNVSTKPEDTGVKQHPFEQGSKDIPYMEDQRRPARAPVPKNEPPAWVVDQTDRGHYRTITDAINAANPGDRVFVLPGAYEEAIVIDKPLEIIGMGRREEIIVQVSGQNTLSFKTTLGRVVNLTLKQTGGGSDWFAVHIAQGRLELKECDISSESSSCVAIQGGADPRVVSNRIHDGRASGVYVFADGRGTLEGNEIYRNSLAGVSIRSGADSIVRDNRIHDCSGEGIILQENASGTIEDNRIFGNAFSGVEIRENSTALLRHNHIYDGKAGGVYVHKNAQARLEGNHIFNNALAGVAIKTGANPTLRRNFIHDGKQSGIFVNDDGQGTIEDNDIFGNAYSGIEIKTDGNPTVRGNRIYKNSHVAVWVGEGGRGVIENNEFRENVGGSSYISADCESKVHRRGNVEK
jgi:F-box protein 11